MLDASSIIDRMKRCLGARSDARLADALGVSRGAVSLWRKKDAVPANHVISVGQTTGISLDWLFTGKEIEPTKEEKEGTWYKRNPIENARPERFLLDIAVSEVMYWSRQMGFSLDRQSPSALAGKIYLSYENNQIRYLELTRAGGFPHDEAVTALLRPYQGGDQRDESV
ncbi:helix-turn-helix domain-containing protein [Rhodothalassium salexigens]|uniref:helix-turn-helix domain-containing protein n=1 Tax=Rhodothalassium salexigens TaxID=1086 RepID=UPI001914D919|nr:helix-turn-helix domain-containing protein [Rhodothalassium salexigens]